VSTDVSEDHIASIFRVEETRSAKKPASKQVASRRIICDIFLQNVG
jgi:hypothetical protein